MRVAEYRGQIIEGRLEFSPKMPTKQAENKGVCGGSIRWPAPGYSIAVELDLLWDLSRFASSSKHRG